VTETLVFHSDFDSLEDWRALLSPLVPNLELVCADDVRDPASTEYAMVWKPPHGFFQRYPNLRWIVNLGAGADAIIMRTDLPPVPISRLSDENMTRMMASYLLFAVLRHARDIPQFERAQRRRRWEPVRPRQTCDISVGVLGLGELGGAAAREIARLGFRTKGWSRTPKSIPGVSCFSGSEILPQFLKETEILIVMLPLTSATRGLLDHRHLSALPKGAKIINASRGPVVDEQALIELLQSGHIAEATLDVFEKEPLSSDSPLWSMDNVLITPHVASVAIPSSSAQQVAESIARIRRGQPPLNLIDPKRGY
jgi:glyoxylate/hydroxypyruvate reductase A